jgi:hypothetical protein
VVARLQEALQGDFRCHFPERATSNLRHLSQAIELAATEPGALTGRQVGMARRILADSEARWGRLGSRRRLEANAIRAVGSSLPFEAVRSALIERLRRLPQEQGIDDLDSVLAPVATEWGTLPVPVPLARRVRQAWSAPVAELVTAGIVDSPKALASISAHWASNLGNDPRELRRQLREMAGLALTLYPHLPVADSMLKDWNLCLERCGDSLRLVPAGSCCSAEHLQLARTTATASQGTLYQHYYSLPATELQVAGPEELWSLCRQRARQRGSMDPPPAQLKEELRVLTGDGLWSLWTSLPPAFEPRDGARRIAERIRHWLQQPCFRKYQRWQRHKRVALAWQRMVFCLSLAGAADLVPFLREQRELSPGGPAGRIWMALLAQLEQPLATSPAEVLLGWDGGRGPLSE